MTESEAVTGIDNKSPVNSNSLRRGRLSQFMIFLNGFVLTITAFTILLIFIDQIQTSKLHTLNENVLAGVQEYFETASDSLEKIPYYDQTALKVGAPLYKKLSKEFSNLFILSKASNSRWQIRKVLDDLNDEEFRRIAKRFDPKQYSAMNKVYFMPIDTNAMQIASVMRSGDNRYIVGLLHADHIANIMQAHPMVRKLNVFDNNTGIRMLRINNVSNKFVMSHGETSQIIETLNVGGMNLTITTDISNEAYISFMGKLPYLLLLFGGTLTIIGTLYIRNNHQKTLDLEVLNRSLETKNTALITDVKKAERLQDLLQRKEKDYEIVLNSVQDVFFEMDVKGNVGFINNAWHEVTQHNASDIAERNIFDFISMDQRPDVQKLFEAFLSDGKTRSVETQIICADRSLKAIELVFASRYEIDNGEQKIIGTIKDIQDRQRAEHALTEVEKKYRTIVDNVAGGIYQATPEGNIVSGNPALAHILGYEDVDALIQSDLNMNECFVSASDRKQYQIALNKDGFIRNHEAELLNAKDEKIWVNENARCVRDIDGTILYYEGSIEDITQRKEAETALIQEKLNSDLASRAKSEFLANMSHELRTPLNSIIGFSEIIKGEALGEIENKLYVDYAKDIYDSGGRLLNVINEILGISRIEAGERQLNESIVDVREIVGTCLNLQASKIENSELEINNLLDEGLPSIVAEELAFKQIFMNLFSNAIKFTPVKGKITISSDYEEGKELRISITDTGVGIDDGDIPKALSPFGQIDNNLSRSNAGTGLGLTLVSSLLRLHRAEFEMISQKNIGTTVTIVIPAKRIVVKKQNNSDEQSDNVASFKDYKNLN